MFILIYVKKYIHVSVQNTYFNLLSYITMWFELIKNIVKILHYDILNK